MESLLTMLAGILVFSTQRSVATFHLSPKECCQSLGVKNSLIARCLLINRIPFMISKNVFYNVT